MKISEVLKITNIPEVLGVSFKDYEIIYGDYSPSPFKLDKNVIWYQTDLTVGRVNILDCFARTREKAENKLAQFFENAQLKQHQLNRYVVLYFILTAVHAAKGQKQSVTKDELIKVGFINRFLLTLTRMSSSYVK